MPYELTEIALFGIVFLVPLLLGFSASELFKGVVSGGSVAFLGVLIFALLFDGWHDTSNVTQKVFLKSVEVVPVATLLALVGYIAKRLLLFVRGDQKAAG